jgi:threonine/homoserine/homoserine lactone efflux protein
MLRACFNRQPAMFGIHDFGLFLATGVLLNLTPGPDTVYILGRSITHGRRAGVASALGISVGSIFHTCAAALGLSAFLATSASAFTAVKLAGAAYLIFLGVRALLERNHDLSLPAQFKRNDAAAAFRQGVLTNILNPKVALFFLAFLPQFIEAATPSKMVAFLILGLTFVTTGTLWCLILAWFSSAFSARLRGNTTAAALLNRIVGSLFIFLGLRLALAARR